MAAEDAAVDTALDVRGVVVRHGPRTALAGVDLVVRPGERVAVVGPSGAGKSTLIGVLGGTVAPSSGSVRVLGADLVGAPPRGRRAVQRRIGTVHQRFDLVGELRVVHNVNAGRLGSWPWWRAAVSLVRPLEVDAAHAALARVGLADRLAQRTASLSGGEQQRVALARVLVQRPDLVLADEPVASLDPARGAEVMALLHALARESGTTLVASLHDVALAWEFPRVIGLRAGRVVFDAPPERVDRAEVAALYAIDDPGSVEREHPARADRRPGC